MMSPGFIDLIMLLILVGFTIKGYATGFARSLITAGALVGGWVVSGIFPHLMSFIISYSVHPGTTFHEVALRISSFLVFYALLQVGGFFLTGLFENLQLGSLDKFVGVCLGVTTGVLTGCFIVSTFFSHPQAYYSPAGVRYAKTSLSFKAYMPMVKKFVHVPHNPDADE